MATTWLSGSPRQPWCDGNVGMIGYSYYGCIQLKVAIEQPPHLKAIFVSHLVNDFYRDGVIRRRHTQPVLLWNLGWPARHERFCRRKTPPP